MRSKNLAALDRITLPELEETLNLHTLKQIPVDQWTEFSWSVSRHSLFDRCKRQYYLNYYGARRVREAQNEMVSAIWWLKQGITLKMWIGSVVHNVVQQAMRAYRDGQPMTHAEVLGLAVQLFHGGLIASERGSKHEGQWVVLMEHLYPDDKLLIDPAAEQTLRELIHNFLTSESYALIRSLPAEAIYEIDESFQSFLMEGIPKLGSVRIFAIPDLLLMHNDVVTIIDWKTGDAERETIRYQAGVYRLYAHEAYNIPEYAINVQIVDLAYGGQVLEPPGGTPTLDETQEFITGSIASMVERMDYPMYNTVSIENFPMTDDLVLCQTCPFKRACWRHTGTHE